MEYDVKILAGPTASGKTALALDYAKCHDVVIINADSKQVFKEIPIITAQPTAQEQAVAPHALYGVISAKEHCSTGRWLSLVKPAIIEAWQQGKIPLLVGGTGMYLKSLVEGIAPIPDIDPKVRDATRQRFHELGNARFYQELASLDSDIAQTLNEGDSQRIIRAYEVVKHTGKSLFYWQQQTTQPVLPDANYQISFLKPDREKVYERCNKRFEAMISQGVIDEVEALDTMELDTALPAMKAHGVPELLAFLHHEMSLEEAIAQSQRNTRHYIKRQFTWFKHQLKDIVVLDGADPQL